MGRRGLAVVLAVGTGMWVFLTSGGWQVGGDMDLLAWGGDLMAKWGVHVYVHQPKLLVGPLPLLYAKAMPLWLELVTPAVVAGVTVWLVARRDLWWAVVLLPVLIAAPATGGVEDAVTAWCALGVVVWLRERPWLAGLLLGVGVGCKPWILPLAVLAVALPRRRAVEFLAAAGAVVAVVWGPFLLGDLGTLHALGSYHPRAGALPSPDWWGWLRLAGLVVIVAVCAWPEVRAWRDRERSREAVPVAG